MPVEYEIDPEARLVRIRVWGRIRATEVEERFRELAGDDAFRPSYSELLDAREVEHVDFVPNDIIRIAGLSRYGRGSLRAIVARSLLIHGLARTYAALRAAGPETIRVFVELRDAERWLATRDLARIA